MELPTSIVWLSDSTSGQLIVSDTRRGYLHVVSEDGDYQGVWESDEFRFPYLAGQRGDSVVVFNRGHNRLEFVVDGAIQRSVELPEDDVSAVGVTDSTIFAKRTEEDTYDVAMISETGEVAARYGLVGPYWRHFGFMRPAREHMLSLSGYRPVVDLIAPNTENNATLDTLALVGFDSPQLVRSNQFLREDVDEPPLLISSLAYHNERLYVVNMRGERIRIDVYTMDGQLEQALEYVDPMVVREAFPADIAIKQGDDGLFIALVMQEPGGVFSRPGGSVLMLRAPAE